MKSSDSSTLLQTELSAFLFAPICEEKNGMPLSVVSALARLGVDPWQEAARLARLPNAAAAAALAATIGRMSGGVEQLLDAPKIAARLVRLLPKPGVASPADEVEGRKKRSGAAVWLLWLLLGAVVIATIWL